MALSVKPNRASGYDSNRTALVRRACLEIATRLSDFKDDLCIIGGLVPSLLIDMATLPPDATAHVGTNDLDLGFSLAILSDEKYEEVANRLRKAGFRPDVNESGNPTSQRWRLPEGVLVDFLIEPSSALDKGGQTPQSGERPCRRRHARPPLGVQGLRGGQAPRPNTDWRPG